MPVPEHGMIINFFEKIATLTNVDYIDYHIYPPQFNYINDIAFKLILLQTPTTKTGDWESWCYKATNSEMTNINQPVATSQLNLLERRIRLLGFN